MYATLVTLILSIQNVPTIQTFPLYARTPERCHELSQQIINQARLCNATVLEASYDKDSCELKLPKESDI